MIGQLVAALQGITGVSFASFDYIPKERGGRAKVQVILGASTANVYEKDVAALRRVVPLLKAVHATLPTIQAAEELLASRLESLEKGIGNNSAYTLKDTFTPLAHLPGLKIHNETGDLYITGLVERWEVVEEGAPKKAVKSSDKTLAKREIEKRFLSSQRIKTLVLAGVTGARLAKKVLSDGRAGLVVAEQAA